MLLSLTLARRRCLGDLRRHRLESITAATAAASVSTKKVHGPFVSVLWRFPCRVQQFVQF